MGKEKRSKKRLLGKLRKKDKKDIEYQYITDFKDEVKLPPHLRKIWDYATNFANAASMYESHLIKPSKNVKKQLDSRYIKIRVKKNKIKRIIPVESIPVEKLEEYEKKVKEADLVDIMKDQIVISSGLTKEELFGENNPINDIKAMEKMIKEKGYYNPMGKMKLTEAMKKRLFGETEPISIGFKKKLARESEDKD